ncbi:transglutaminase TgpA family protein [Paenibacillus physcomitrellae]|uniref:Transglutaminase-like domain-containing protein n=1 Tax=Paenibacillus physcomitrellae TaxID=1619311 RepID=A0ABQ1FLD5_9BACL|nr:transglutaminase domain-containing protein [Paenibacillus physcomitrellae]GGA20100.1 hypothetical protein GCM10010917_00900 [Paenibacillus physcomitrellae]
MNKLRSGSRSWYYLASVVWLFILAYQWYRFTEPVWLDKTSNLVLYTLIVTAAAEFLPIGSVFRWLVKLAAMAVLHIRLLGIYHIFSDQYAYLPISMKIRAAVEQLAPYIWFTVAAWALFELAVRVIERRSRILIFLGLNIIAFTIFDSFTPYSLWTETAWVVFAGMGWLVSNHFRRMELNHPRGWKALRRRPLRIVANIAFIFAAVLWIGVSMPTISPVLEDPYTLMQKYWNGGNTTSAGGASNGEASGKSGSGTSGTTSGYSRDDSKLGGGFQFDSSPVMNVVSDSRAYWRGETREYYTGTGWIDDARENTGPRSAESGEGVVNPQGGTAAKHQITQRITMLNQEKYPVLFGAYSITQVDIPTEPEEADARPKLIWSGKRATMYWGGFTSGSRGNGNYPRQYTVVSEVPEYSEDELQKETFDQLYGTESDDKQAYLQLPSAFPDRVKDLAEQVTASTDTPYGKIMLLRDYLRTNFRYTNTPDLSKKTTHDFVDSFLFEIKEGYCDYFSTALVMMARSLDIPARWVKGYAPGQLGTASDLAEKAGDPDNQLETYMVTNADAHSWAEVYLGETYGWVPVEATPGFSLPDTAPVQEQEDEPVDEQQPEEEEEASQPDQPAQADVSDSSISASVISWILAAALVLWAAFATWRNRTALYFMMLRLKHGQHLSSADKVVAESRRWLAIMKRQGYKRAEHETIRETVMRWEREHPEVAELLEPLLRQFEQAKYSAETVGEEDWRTTIRLSRQLKVFLLEQKRKQTG